MLEQPNQIAARAVTNRVVAMLTPIFGQVSGVGVLRTTFENTAAISSPTIGACAKRTAVPQPSATLTAIIRFTSVSHWVNGAVLRGRRRDRGGTAPVCAEARLSTQIDFATDDSHCRTHSATGRLERPRRSPSTLVGGADPESWGSKKVIESGKARPNQASLPTCFVDSSRAMTATASKFSNASRLG